MKKLVLIVCFVNLFFIGVCEAAEIENVLNNTDFGEIEKFLSENYGETDFESLLNSVANGEENGGISRLKDYAQNAFFKEVKSSFSMLIKFMATAAAAAILKNFSYPNLKHKNDTVSLISYFVSALIFAQVFLQAVNAARDVVFRVNEFVGISMPVLMSFVAASGGAKTAACINPVTFIAIEILSYAVNGFFMPMILIMGVLALFSACLKNMNILAVLKSVKMILKWCMGLAFTLFTGTFALFGNISSSQDALAMRAAKYITSASVPVAGTLLCDNMSVFTYSCAVIKNAFGTISIFIVLFITALPAIKLFVIMIFLNIASFVSSMLAEDEISNMGLNLSEAVSYLLAAVCLTGAALIVSMAIVILIQSPTSV